jgi:hypothetical protein
MRVLASKVAAVAAGLALVAQVATAQVFTGTTVGGPTWARPLAGNPPVPPPSGVGTNVAYDALRFQVSASGSYDFLSEGTNPVNWDNYTFLYSGSFNPLAQFTNVIIGNDDLNFVIGRSGFTTNLTAGTNYIFITTGFSNTDAGAFRTTIRGPGTATVVPEPSTYALIATGLAGLALARRRRRAA